MVDMSVPYIKRVLKCLKPTFLFNNLEVLRKAKEYGAAQSVVVCGHLDQRKRTLLNHIGYSITSE